MNHLVHKNDFGHDGLALNNPEHPHQDTIAKL